MGKRTIHRETIAETNRLVLEKLTVNDSPFILELVNTPSWIRYIGKRGIKTTLSARRYILDGPMKSYTENGWGLYRITLKQTGSPIGLCGLVKRPELTLPDLGFALLPEYQQSGFAYEAAQEVINLARKKHQLHKLLAITDKDNKRSIALLEKLGFVYQKNSSQNIADNLLLFSQPLRIV